MRTLDDELRMIHNGVSHICLVCGQLSLKEKPAPRMFKCGNCGALYKGFKRQKIRTPLSTHGR